MDIEQQLTLSREEQLSLKPTVRIDISDAPLLDGGLPEDNPRVYGMTDAEALEWNAKKAKEREQQ